ncbi:sunset domain-containing protein [Gemella morbillorum]
MKNVKKGELILWVIFGFLTLISVLYLFDTGLLSALKLFIPTLLVTFPPIVKKYPIKKVYMIIIAVIVMSIAIANTDEFSYAKVRREQQEKRLIEEKEKKEQEEKRKEEVRQKELSDKKERVDKEIREYSNLSQGEKDKFLERVSSANEAAEIDKIKEEAERLDKKNRDKKEQESKDLSSAKNESSSLPSGSQSTQSSTPASTGQGIIKGNKKSRIYHLPGQKDYDNISPRNVVYFNSEAEAQAAGYRVAKR